MQHMIGTSRAPGKARHADRHAHTGTAAQPTRDAAHILAARHLATSTIDDIEDTTMTAPAARCARGPISMITLVSRSIVSRTAAGSSGSARLGHSTQLNGQHSPHSHHQAPTAIRQPPKAQRSATWRGAMAGLQLAAGRRWPGAARRGAT